MKLSNGGLRCWLMAWSLVVGWMVNPAAWGLESDRPDSGYQVLVTLNAGWTIQVEAEPAVPEVPAIVPAAWESFLGPDFDGIATYRLELSPEQSRAITEQWQPSHSPTGVAQQLYLTFDGVATEAEARLNGQVIGQHLGPWTPWACRLDEHWRPEGPNRIEVRVDEKVGHHTQGFLPVIAPHFGGIWQPVRLELRPVKRIETANSLVLGRYSADGDHRIDLDLKLSPQVQAGQRLEIRVESPRRLIAYRSRPLLESPLMAGVAKPQVGQGMDGAADWQADWLIADDRKPQVFEFTLSEEDVRQSQWRQQLAIPDGLPWSPETPWLYLVRVRLLSVTPAGAAEWTDEDTVAIGHHAATFRTGIRHYQTRGHQLLVNGKPTILEGMLNWGYAPPSTAPTLDPGVMWQELEAARRLGLNLMKFCLWIPPQPYLELADEMGMLTWIEYPTWHAQLIEENLPELSREYLEFTDYDRNHPSVVLRSLTCETGSSAQLIVIQHLYDLVHRQVPGAIVEDDSSWISWNRVSDIWDDHPYGNNHTWVATLQRLRDFIAQREAKPLVLGEAIAADTWPDLEALAAAADQSQQLPDSFGRPFWLFGFFEAAGDFQRRLEEAGQPHALARLREDSIRYAYLMRKFQVETYRREVPWGGYVLSVIRDFPLAAMGLLDPWGNNKFPDWDLEGPFHVGDPLLVLQTESDRRSWSSGQTAEWTMLLATARDLPAEATAAPLAELLWQWVEVGQHEGEHAGQDLLVLAEGKTEWHLLRPESLTATRADHPSRKLSTQLPTVDRVTPVELRVQVTLRWQGNESESQVENRWPMWLFPTTDQTRGWRLEAAADLSSRARQWLEGESGLPSIQWVTATEPNVDDAAAGDDADAATVNAAIDVAAETLEETVVVASRFSPDLVEQLLSGRRVLMLPDGGPGSFPKQAHWFLRGGPILFDHPLLKQDSAGLDALQNALRDLQHFDLADDVLPQFDYWDQCSPVLALWDNHDIKEVKVHGLLWEARVGQGRLMVSHLNHDPQRGAAGPFLLNACLQHLHRPAQPKSWSEATVQRLQMALAGRDVDLSKQAWRLQPDPDERGFQEQWHDPQLETVDWTPIRIDAHWEGQGFPQLDGWAWYATEVQIPADWEGTEFYLCFTGVDDHYQAFVNSQKIGQAGVIETRETAFEMRTSHRLPGDLQPGDRLVIRVAVYDWHGAGGIFRPVYLRTTPLSDLKPILQQ